MSDCFNHEADAYDSWFDLDREPNMPAQYRWGSGMRSGARCYRCQGWAPWVQRNGKWLLNHDCPGCSLDDFKDYS